MSPAFPLWVPGMTLAGWFLSVSYFYVWEALQWSCYPKCPTLQTRKPAWFVAFSSLPTGMSWHTCGPFLGLGSHSKIINVWWGEVCEPYWTVSSFFLFFPPPVSKTSSCSGGDDGPQGFPVALSLLVPLWMSVCFLTSLSLITTPSIPCFCNYPCRDRAPLCPKNSPHFPSSPHASDLPHWAWGVTSPWQQRPLKTLNHTTSP